MIADNLCNCGLFAQLRISCEIGDCSHCRDIAGFKIHVQTLIYVDFLAKSRISLAFINITHFFKRRVKYVHQKESAVVLEKGKVFKISNVLRNVSF